MEHTTTYTKLVGVQTLLFSQALSTVLQAYRLSQPDDVAISAAAGIYSSPRSASCLLLITTDGDGGRVEEAAHRHSTPLYSFHNRRNLLYGTSGFPLGS